MADLLTSLRDHLVTAGVVRDPLVAGPLPPLWREPRDGVPAPGEGDSASEVGATLVVGAFIATGIPPKPYEGFIRTDAVELIIRASKASLLKPFEEQVREAVNDRRNFYMGTLWVESAYLFRDMAIIDRSTDGGWTASLQYLFSLWGGPLAPPTG